MESYDPDERNVTSRFTTRNGSILSAQLQRLAKILFFFFVNEASLGVAVLLSRV